MARTKQRARKASGKRKREADTEGPPLAKRQELERPEQTTCDEAVSRMNPSLISDHFAKALRKHSNSSTVLELEDQYIATKSIQDTTSFSQPHLAKHLSEYLETFGGGKDALSYGELASPHTLIITSSGIRAADLAREVRVFAKGEAKVAKLFAKHMKLAENITFVKTKKLNIGVGTPSRPRELIEKDALDLCCLRRIVIDGSYLDEKHRTIFDMADVFLPLVELLNMRQIKPRLGAEEKCIEILVF